jgi:TM2 domain-containing membrane protein YozV
MTSNQDLLIEQRVQHEAPNKLVAYLLWLFLGWIAAHRFYAGKPGSAVLMIIAWLCGFVPGFLWWIVDAFLLSGLIDNRRSQIRRQVVSSLVTYEPVVSAPVAAQNGQGDDAAELEKFAKLHASGILTDEEYSAKKRAILRI